MNKEEFIVELEKKLKKLPKEEKETAIIYYKEYFEEAGEDKEVEVIKEIGTPSEIASQILANFAVKETNSIKKETNVKKSFSTTWMIILAILASPIALPIAIVIIMLIFVAWIFIIAWWIAGVASSIGGALYIILSIFILLQDVYLALFMIGVGMIAIAFGIALTIGSSTIFIKYSTWITKKISKVLLRKEEPNEK